MFSTRGMAPKVTARASRPGGMHQGEGSHGGVVIGHTKAGRAVYATRSRDPGIHAKHHRGAKADVREADAALRVEKDPAKRKHIADNREAAQMREKHHENMAFGTGIHKSEEPMTYAEQMAEVFGEDDSIEKGGKRGDLTVNKDPFPTKKKTGATTVRPGKTVAKNMPVPKQLKAGMKKGEDEADEQDTAEEQDGEGLQPSEGAVEKGKGGMCKSCNKPSNMCKCDGAMKKSVPATLGAAVMLESMHGMSDDDIAKAVQSGELGIGGLHAGLGRRG